MKKVTKELLKDIANNLMIDLSDDEYDKLLKDFDILREQFSIFENDDNLRVDK